MEWREMFFAVYQALLLLVLSSVQSSTAKQCKCSDIPCIDAAAESSNSTEYECCLWDFPLRTVSTAVYEFQEMGFAFGRTTVNVPHFCITYPIAEDNVDKNNYFLVKLDLQGPDVCIYEPGKQEHKNCSVILHEIPVSKAAYCSGEAVSGVQSVNFIVDCTDCTTNDATFQFRVYSESFNETQAHWCEHVDRTVPSEVQIDKDDTNKPGPEVGATLEMDRGNNSSGAPKLNPLLSTLVIVVLAAMSVA